MEIKIHKFKKGWNLEIYDNNNLLDSITTFNLEELKNSNLLTKYISTKGIINIEHNDLILFNKKYPKIKRSSILIDVKKTISKIYDNKFEVLFYNIVKNNNNLEYVGLLIDSSLNRFIQLHLKKYSIKSLFNEYYEIYFKKYENCLLIDNSNFILVINSKVILIDILNSKTFENVIRNISLILYDKLFVGCLYLLYKEEDYIKIMKIKSELNKLIEKQVNLIEKQI